MYESHCFYVVSCSPYITPAARIREILEHVGLVQESLPSNVVSSSQVLASVANLLNIRDTELSRWVFNLKFTQNIIRMHQLTRRNALVFL